MAEAINAQNIDAYLLYLANKLEAPLPAPYNNPQTFTGKPPAELAQLLESLYDRLGIPKQTGWSHEDAFLREAAQTPVTGWTSPTIPPPMSSGPAYQYYPVAPGIGRMNFKPFLYWVEERLKRSLDLFGISAWDQYSDEGIRQLLPNIYRAAEISPDDAKQLELGFLAVYHQKVAPMPIQPTPVATAPPPPPPTQQASMPTYQATTTTVRQVPSRRSRQLIVPGIILLVVLGALGAWLWSKYNAYRQLPYVYALTNNIALRKDATDTAPVLGRMDIYGQYLNGKNMQQPSVERLKLRTPELTNGFYEATSSTGFWNYLTGNDSTIYVHTKYVTTDAAVHEKYTEDLSNLKNDFNELDKLGFIYRQLIGRAVLKSSNGAVLKIAAACKPSPKLSRVAPVSIAKYRNRNTGELNVLIQATDGFCYALRGGENNLPPTITPVMVMYGTFTEPMKAGGMITPSGSGNGIKFEYCNDGQVFYSQPPYTLFLPLPARTPVAPPPTPADTDAVPMDDVDPF